MLCVLILAAPRLFSPALPPSLRQTLWALSSAAVKPATLTPRAVLPLLEANAWTDMKRKLQQLQLPAATDGLARGATRRALRHAATTTTPCGNLLRPIYTYHCRAIKHSSGGSSADKREKKQRRARRQKAAEKKRAAALSIALYILF